MDQGATILALIVGAIAGWLAARVLKRTGFGVVGDIVVGMIGGFIGAWVWTFLHPAAEGAAMGFDVLHTIASSAVGGIVLLVLWRLARR